MIHSNRSPIATDRTPERDRIETRASFDSVRYANCWEDPDILCEALQVAPGSRILSIASAGDNVLALLAEGAEVVAADLSLAQLACLELRVAAFRRLDYEGVLAFLGVRRMPDRLVAFGRLKSALSPAVRDFWDARPQDVARGIIHVGRFENYFRVFRERVLRLVHSRRTIARLLEPRDAAGRRAFYEKTWNNLRWRLLFRVFFSRFVMGRLGRDPEFFRYVEGSVSDRILARAEHGLTAIPTHTNPFLDYILNGNYTQSLPRYLEPMRFAAVRDGLDRLVLFHGPIEEAAHAHRGDGFDGFNLSDIFEYIDEEATRENYASLLNDARPGAHLAYWNTFVPRGRPAALADRARPLTEVSAGLHERDRAFFYGDFHVDEVIPFTERRKRHEGVLHTDGAGLRVAFAAAG